MNSNKNFTVISIMSRIWMIKKWYFTRMESHEIIQLQIGQKIALKVRSWK